MNKEKKLQITLFTLRLGVFIVMFMWTLDKIVRPEHAAMIYDSFYFLPDLNNTTMLTIGIIEMAIIIGFLLGIYKRFTYGIVFLVHAISTVSSLPGYLMPFVGPHLLFFAAWPMLAACFTLYLLRDEDNFLVVHKSKA